MIRKATYLALTFLVFCAGKLSAIEPNVGIVNFANCLTESKMGKQEQNQFEALKNQLSIQVEPLVKKISLLESKLTSKEYLEGITPQKEEKLKAKYQTLSGQMQYHQNQCYQQLNQTNMKMIQSIGVSIQEASEKVARNKKLSMVANKDAFFFSLPTLDVTNLVIAEMDLTFEQKAKAMNLANPAEAVVEQKAKADSSAKQTERAPVNAKK